MTNKVIIFLIRKKLKLKTGEQFKFANQKSDAVYWFTKYGILKKFNGSVELSGVSLNWLLDRHCKVIKITQS